MSKYWKAAVNLLLTVVILVLVIWLVPKALVFFAPFVIGWIIALIAAPAVRFFEEKLKIKRKAGSAVVIVAVIAIVVFLIYFLGTKLVEQMVGLVEALPELWAGAEGDFNDIAKNFDVIYERLPVDLQESITGVFHDIGAYMGDLVSSISAPTITAVSNLAKSVPSVLIGIIMALLSSYFFVAEHDTVGAWLRDHMPASIQAKYFMLKKGLFQAVGGYFKAQLKIEVWMYVLLVVGLLVLKVKYTPLIALGIAFLDFLPFFGTGTVMVPWAIIKFLSSDYKMAIGLLIIWGVGQLARQLIQPKIVGDSVGMAPLPTLFLLFIGYKVGSVVGMILAVPLGLVIVTMYQEGAFNTTRDSVRIIVAGVNHFRRIKAEDLEEVRHMKEKDRRLSEELDRQMEEQRKRMEEEKQLEKAQNQAMREKLLKLDRFGSKKP